MSFTVQIIQCSGLSRERMLHMLAFVDSPESMPVLPQTPETRSLFPADFLPVSYSPAFLLPVEFDPSLTHDPEYQEACHVGFDDAFGRLSEEDERELFTWEMVRNEVLRSLLDVEKVLPPGFPTLSLAWASGFLLGWLSALALIDRSLALSGLELLTVLVVYM
jgi:hypothetical protein